MTVTQRETKRERERERGKKEQREGGRRQREKEARETMPEIYRHSGSDRKGRRG